MVLRNHSLIRVVLGEFLLCSRQSTGNERFEVTSTPSNTNIREIRKALTQHPAMRVREQVKSLVTKPDDLSSITGAT